MSPIASPPAGKLIARIADSALPPEYAVLTAELNRPAVPTACAAAPKTAADPAILVLRFCPLVTAIMFFLLVIYLFDFINYVVYNVSSGD
jgi:hypothetical protein